jgi:hypothetical protein
MQRGIPICKELKQMVINAHLERKKTVCYFETVSFAEIQCVKNNVYLQRMRTLRQNSKIRKTQKNYYFNG